MLSLAVRVMRRALVMLAVLALSACGPIASPSPSTSPAIPVLGTENFYADLLAQIGGAAVYAAGLLRAPRAAPHAGDGAPRTAKPRPAPQGRPATRYRHRRLLAE